ncbi:MAG: hypothetical protein WDO73_03530 [Ignavibacteriota bacterium]
MPNGSARIGVDEYVAIRVKLGQPLTVANVPQKVGRAWDALRAFPFQAGA